MGKKRPLKPQIAARYNNELAAAEQMAQKGFDPKTKKLDPNIYGPTNMKFDPVAEMQRLKDNAITDGSFLEASLQEFGQMKPPSNMINDALDAVQAEDPSFPMPDPNPDFTPPVRPPVASQSMEEEEEEAESEIPMDPDKKLEWVAEQLQKINPNAPNANVLKQWKQLHGNVFVLQIDDYVFIYRYLKRQEWKQLQANEAFHNRRIDEQEDYITNKCLLWPRLNPHTEGALPAGASSMLAEQIRIQSMFLDPMQVANITIKL